MTALKTRLGPGVCRARVLDVDARAVCVRCDATDEGLACDVLRASGGAPLLLPGDRVLVWSDGEGRGVVLGLVEPPGAEAREAEEGDAAAHDPSADGGPLHRRHRDGGPGDARSDDIPDTLVIEARESLTLRVGEGSIVLRGDGKVVIRGKDLVSRATRTNRIKGGSVSIN